MKDFFQMYMKDPHMNFFATVPCSCVSILWFNDVFEKHCFVKKSNLKVSEMGQGVAQLKNKATIVIAFKNLLYDLRSIRISQNCHF